MQNESDTSYQQNLLREAGVCKEILCLLERRTSVKSTTRPRSATMDKAGGNRDDVGVNAEDEQSLQVQLLECTGHLLSENRPNQQQFYEFTAGKQVLFKALSSELTRAAALTVLEHLLFGSHNRQAYAAGEKKTNCVSVGQFLDGIQTAINECNVRDWDGIATLLRSMRKALFYLPEVCPMTAHAHKSFCTLCSCRRGWSSKDAAVFMLWPL